MAIKSVERETLTFTWATSGTTVASATVPATSHGWVQYYSYVMPAASAVISGTLSYVDDSTDRTYYTGTSNVMTGAATSGVTAQNIPILGGDSIVKITLNTIPGCAAGVSAVPLTGYVDLYFVT